MSEKHKELLRRAAREMARAEGRHYLVGMCWALLFAANELGDRSGCYSYCGGFVNWLYRGDSPYCDSAFWMGPDFTPKQQQHRIMALLFAAECFDDMGGV